jgi:hypothetical protein
VSTRITLSSTHVKAVPARGGFPETVPRAASHCVCSRVRPYFRPEFAVCYAGRMSEARKITANLPREALARAQRLTGKGVTATLVDALAALDRESKRTALRRLRGKVSFELDLEKTRR